MPKAAPIAVLALAPLLAAALAAGSSAFAGSGKPRPRPEPSPAARPVGTPTSCIPLNQIRESKVRDDWTIDFVAAGKRAWRNTLTARCPGLRINNAITYETSLNQLCNTDIVYVLETAGGIRRGAACSLGQFVPVELER
ncbi:MAG TPA: hypothetical protein VF440_01810 [Novosphingobium sp.]